VLLVYELGPKTAGVRIRCFQFMNWAFGCCCFKGSQLTRCAEIREQGVVGRCSSAAQSPEKEAEGCSKVW